MPFRIPFPRKGEISVIHGLQHVNVIEGRALLVGADVGVEPGIGETKQAVAIVPPSVDGIVGNPSLLPQLLFQPSGVRDFDDADDVHAAQTKGLEWRVPSRFHDPIRPPRMTHTRDHD